MRKKYLLVSILIFCSGIAVGSIATTFYATYKVVHFVEEGPKGINRLIVSFGKRFYKLDDTQAAELQAIVDKYQQIIRKRRKERFSEEKVIIDQLKQDLRSILKTPEQQEKAERFEKLLDNKFNNFSDVKDK